MTLYTRSCPCPNVIRDHHLETFRQTIRPNVNDWLVCHEPFREREPTLIPKHRRIMLMGEPSSLARIDLRFLNQFGILVSPFHVPGFQGTTIVSQPGLPWFFGWNRSENEWLDFAQLQKMESIQKRPDISVVVSNKSFHRGHRIRLQLVRILQQRLGERLQVFGKGIREVADKRDAIAPYQYHLSLENSTEPNYWSEKLSDAYLGGACPIYLGCTNIERWFAPESMYRIELDETLVEPKLSIALENIAERIAKWLDSDPYPKHIHALREARERVLHDYSFFAVLRDAIISLGESAGVPNLDTPDWMHPQASPKGRERWWRELTRVYHKWTTRSPRVAPTPTRD